MQLRDSNSSIAHPDSWGFFGGGIEQAETSRQGANREIMEELGLRRRKLYYLGSEVTKINFISKEKIKHYIYTSYLRSNLADLTLAEGVDMKLIGIGQFRNGKIYSRKTKRTHLIARNHIISKYFLLAQKLAGRHRSGLSALNK
jgi:8-oxo-dGTP pyrophosphatase MutT (NUDIX family)